MYKQIVNLFKHINRLYFVSLYRQIEVCLNKVYVATVRPNMFEQI